MKDRSHLNWTRGAKGFALHVGKSSLGALLHVVPDKRWPQMWRIRRRDNSLSDLLNLARAKDAAQSQALTELHAQRVGKRSQLAARMLFPGSPVSDTGESGERLHGATVQPPAVVTETLVTDDEAFTDEDGGWGTRVKRPAGTGWQVADYSDERRTRWRRRLLVPARGRP